MHYRRHTSYNSSVETAAKGCPGFRIEHSPHHSTEHPVADGVRRERTLATPFFYFMNYISSRYSLRAATRVAESSAQPILAVNTHNASAVSSTHGSLGLVRPSSMGATAPRPPKICRKGGLVSTMASYRRTGSIAFGFPGLRTPLARHRPSLAGSGPGVDVPGMLGRSREPGNPRSGPLPMCLHAMLPVRWPLDRPLAETSPSNRHSSER